MFQAELGLAQYSNVITAVNARIALASESIRGFRPWADAANTVR